MPSSAVCLLCHCLSSAISLSPTTLPRVQQSSTRTSTADILVQVWQRCPAAHLGGWHHCQRSHAGTLHTFCPLPSAEVTMMNSREWMVSLTACYPLVMPNGHASTPVMTRLVCFHDHLLMNVALHHRTSTCFIASLTLVFYGEMSLLFMRALVPTHHHTQSNLPCPVLHPCAPDTPFSRDIRLPYAFWQQLFCYSQRVGDFLLTRHSSWRR